MTFNYDNSLFTFIFFIQHISPPAAKIKINENIPLIKISNPIQKNRKRFSKELLTVNNKTTTNIQKETAICNQHTSSSSVGISTDSDSSSNNQQPKRKNINLTFAGNNIRDSYIALPTKIVTVRNPITNNTFNDNSSSDSEFSLSRFNIRRRYCSKKLDSTDNNIKTHHKKSNNNNNNLVKKQETATNNNIDQIVKKYPSRRIINNHQKLIDPFLDTDSSSSFSSEYPSKSSSSSDWKINSSSDSSVSTNKKRSTNKNSNHDSIKKQYSEKIQKKIRTTRNSIARSRKRILRTTNVPKITKNIFSTIHVAAHTKKSNNTQKPSYQSDSPPTDDPT